VFKQLFGCLVLFKQAVWVCFLLFIPLETLGLRHIFSKKWGFLGVELFLKNNEFVDGKEKDF
jgi:hypothetical protein